MAETTPPLDTSELISSLHQTLAFLSTSPYPNVPNPPSCKKRASVALLIRIRPHYSQPPPASSSSHTSSDSSDSSRLESFFSQPWVQQGDPEVAFIKRAARVGDRWTSHVALPGGKRDPEDEDDRATAMRETFEEVGLDLNREDVLSVGHLPERVVSTSWGKVPRIMVLCPFVFLYTNAEVPPLRLQPTEVASTHWVPLRVLLSPAVRTYEYVDVTDRFARQGGFILKALISSVLGKMRFSAIRLIPSESTFCSSTAEFFSPENSDTPTSLVEKIYNWYLGDRAGLADKTRPLLLWGLTLGVLADFLDQLPPHNAVKLWSHPTFTTWDTRFIIHILTKGLKKRNEKRLQGGNQGNQTAVDSETEAIAPTGDNPWFIGGLSDGMKCKGNNKTKEYAVGVMLEGYYDMARRGVWIAFITRIFGSLALAIYIIRRYRRRS